MVLNVIEVDKINDFLPQNNGEISDSITQNWTVQAVECYKLRCECSKCSIASGHYSFVCQMPKIVEALIKASGKPQAKASLKIVK